MNSIKEQIDSSFEAYEFKSGVDELFLRYKKRRLRLKVLLSSFSGAAVVVIAFLLTGVNMFGIIPNEKLSVKVYAVDVGVSETMLVKGKQLVKNSAGVKKQSKKVFYDADGVEITDGKNPSDSFCRTVIVPSYINLKISCDNARSLKVECGGNGSLFNNIYDDINGKSLNVKNGSSVYWIPNCEKLTKSLKADISKAPSTLKNDELMTQELSSLLKTEEDYNNYFGDTITITVINKDKSVENVNVEITLDEKGNYYTSLY